MAEDKNVKKGKFRQYFTLLSMGLASIVLFGMLLCFGAVDIPLSAVITALRGGNPDSTESIIVLQSRLPMAVAALISGSALSVSGLLLQTTFRNPLAGPSLIGVSSGSSLGVALIMLGTSSIGLHIASDMWMAITGALIGAGAVIMLLLLFSSVLKNPVMLLIAGVMISYLASSVISLLNFFAPSEDVKSFVVWGLGTLTAVRLDTLPLFALPPLLCIGASLLLVKPLNALLLGERYASSMGFSMTRLRTTLLLLSGLLTALVTAFCGPIGFIGLIVPHIARMATATSNHEVLMPATILCGAAMMLLCALCTVIPSAAGVMPINVVTPIFGVPVILYIILRRHKLNYFN